MASGSMAVLRTAPAHQLSTLRGSRAVANTIGIGTIGLLGTGSAAAQSQWTAAFVQRMRELGWVEGRREIDAAFATLGQERPDALFVGGDGFFASRRAQDRRQCRCRPSSQTPDVAGKRLELLREIVPVHTSQPQFGH